MFIIKRIKTYAYVALAIFIIAGALVFGLGLKPSIDFTGGSLTEVSYSEVPEKANIETQLVEVGFEGFSVRESIDETGREGYIIRTKDLSEEERIKITNTVSTLGKEGEIVRFTTIGPVIGEELKSKAKWAIIAVVLVIVFYVAFAFRGLKKPVSSWVYGGITILALIHDVLIPMAVMSVLGYTMGIEVDVLFIMALLAVLGYSVNDTIVSLNQTLVRSINTSVTTLLVLLSLYFLGGEITKTFTLILIAGVIAGTYSSIFIANPLLVLYSEWRPQKDKKD
jgi:preprotein translocase subunit SecF